MGALRVLRLALGASEEESVKPGYHALGTWLNGSSCGVVFTDRSLDEMQEVMDMVNIEGFAKSGHVAAFDVRLEEGQVLEDLEFSQEQYVRKLGLPVKLHRGRIVLTDDHTLCVKGQKMTPEQATLVRLLGHMMSVFTVSIVGGVDGESGTIIKAPDASQGAEKTSGADENQTGGRA